MRIVGLFSQSGAIDQQKIRIHFGLHSYCKRSSQWRHFKVSRDYLAVKKLPHTIIDTLPKSEHRQMLCMTFMSVKMHMANLKVIISQFNRNQKNRRFDLHAMQMLFFFNRTMKHGNVLNYNCFVVSTLYFFFFFVLFNWIQVCRRLGYE